MEAKASFLPAKLYGSTQLCIRRPSTDMEHFRSLGYTLVLLKSLAWDLEGLCCHQSTHFTTTYPAIFALSSTTQQKCFRRVGLMRNEESAHARTGGRNVRSSGSSHSSEIPRDLKTPSFIGQNSLGPRNRSL